MGVGAGLSMIWVSPRPARCKTASCPPACATLLRVPDGEATTVVQTLACSDKQELGSSAREFREIRLRLLRMDSLKPLQDIHSTLLLIGADPNLIRVSNLVDKFNSYVML